MVLMAWNFVISSKFVLTYVVPENMEKLVNKRDEGIAIFNIFYFKLQWSVEKCSFFY